jgi:hypothetical protein
VEGWGGGLDGNHSGREGRIDSLTPHYQIRPFPQSSGWSKQDWTATTKQNKKTVMYVNVRDAGSLLFPFFKFGHNVEQEWGGRVLTSCIQNIILCQNFNKNHQCFRLLLPLFGQLVKNNK